MFGINEETARAAMALAARAVVALETIAERLDALVMVKRHEGDEQSPVGFVDRIARFQRCPTCSLRIDTAGGKFVGHINPAAPDAWCLSSGKDAPK